MTQLCIGESPAKHFIDAISPLWNSGSLPHENSRMRIMSQFYVSSRCHIPVSNQQSSGAFFLWAEPLFVGWEVSGLVIWPRYMRSHPFKLEIKHTIPKKTSKSRTVEISLAKMTQFLLTRFPCNFLIPNFHNSANFWIPTKSGEFSF